MKPTSPIARTVLASLVVTLVPLLVATGCGVKRTSGSPLSKVAEEAKKKPEEQDEDANLREGGYVIDETVVDEERDDLYASHVVASTDTIHSAGAALEPPAAAEPTPEFAGIALEVGPGWYRGDLVRGFCVGGFGSGYLTEKRRVRVDLGLVGTAYEFSGEAAESFTGPFELALSAGGRYYLTSGHTFTGVYGFGSIRFGILGFGFRNPVMVGSSEVESEWIWTLTPEVGVGLSVAQLRNLHVGARAAAGVKIFHDQTLWYAFENDFLQGSGYVRLAFAFSILGDPK